MATNDPFDPSGFARIGVSGRLERIPADEMDVFLLALDLFGGERD